MTSEPYPYLIHTNCELELMLGGKKQLAVFSHEHVAGFKKSDALAGQDFSRYVKEGTISEDLRTYEFQSPDGLKHKIDYWLYTLPGQEWRVEAYCLLLDMLHKHGWCSHLEWLQGILLGYTEEENRYHLSRKYPESECDR